MTEVRGTDPAEDFRRVAGEFTVCVRGASPSAWDAPAPCEGWVARDVVRHLVTWFPAFLRWGTGIELPLGPSVDDDPVAAWTVHADAVQRLLDDPVSRGLVLRDRHVGEIPLPEAIGRFYTSDVFLHRWDLARATGQDERLDPERCAAMLEGMRPMGDALRASGHYGPEVPVPPDADVQTRLLAFIGRRV